MSSAKRGTEAIASMLIAFLLGYLLKMNTKEVVLLYFVLLTNFRVGMLLSRGEKDGQ